jgi:hypothetical protein
MKIVQQLLDAAFRSRRQGVRPIKSAAELVHPEVWETDEELDAFLADLDARRRAGASAS